MPRTRIDHFDNLYFGSVLEGAAEWARSRGTDPTNPLWAEARLLDALQPVTVLDWGCGRGELMAMLASLGSTRGTRCWGFDPSVWSSKFRACTFAEFEVEDLCHGTDSDFTLPDAVPGNTHQGFDLVIARNLFECLDPDAIPRSPMAEVKRTLRKLLVQCRPGGRVALKTTWFDAAFDEARHSRAQEAVRAAGPARHIVPWRTMGEDGRLGLDSEFTLTQLEIYHYLTVVNPWTKGPGEFGKEFFSGLKYEIGSEWLVVTK